MRVKSVELPEDFPTHTIMGLDPGLAVAGVCILDGLRRRALFATARTKNQGPYRHAERVVEMARKIQSAAGLRTVDYLIAEQMQSYDRSRQKGDQQDLINISLVTGAVLALINFKACELLKPNQWKGGVEKTKHHRRLQQQFPWLPNLSKDAMDAFGLAIHAKERYSCLYLPGTLKS